MALAEFFGWYAQEPRPGFGKATVAADHHLIRRLSELRHPIIVSFVGADGRMAKMTLPR
jgi:hypothetical protein